MATRRFIDEMREARFRVREDGLHPRGFVPMYHKGRLREEGRMADVLSNGVLLALPERDRSGIIPHLVRVELAHHQRLASPQRPFEHVFFPGRGLASVIGGVREDIPVEIGIIGREGIVNLPALLGSERSTVEVLVQVPGHAWKLEVERARRIVEESRAFNALVRCCADAVIVQTGASLVAAAKASLSQRLARWLLMAHDRVEDEAIPLTHEFLSFMLGVRRPSVTLALNEFERAGLIERRRGSIVVRAREALLEEAAGFYGMAEQHNNAPCTPGP
jgi:CRP-like cAMP-binding protein